MKELQVLDTADTLTEVPERDGVAGLDVVVLTAHTHTHTHTHKVQRSVMCINETAAPTILDIRTLQNRGHFSVPHIR